jgi:hypothetical protein
MIFCGQSLGAPHLRGPVVRRTGMALTKGSRILLLLLLAAPLPACGTLNSWMARNMGDHVPHWAGGIPSDAPPRPGTPAYQDYRKRLGGDSQPPADGSMPAQPAHESSASRAVY